MTSVLENEFKERDLHSGNETDSSSSEFDPPDFHGRSRQKLRSDGVVPPQTVRRPTVDRWAIDCERNTNNSPEASSSKIIGVVAGVTVKIDAESAADSSHIRGEKRALSEASEAPPEAALDDLLDDMVAAVPDR